MMQTTKLTFDEVRSAIMYTGIEIKDMQYKLSKIVVMQGQSSLDEVTRNRATWVDLLPHKTIQYKVSIKGLLSPIILKFKGTYQEGQELQVDLSYFEEFKQVLSSHRNPTKIEHKTKRTDFSADFLYIRVQSSLKQVSFSFTPIFPKQDVQDHIARELERNRQLDPDYDEK